MINCLNHFASGGMTPLADRENSSAVGMSPTRSPLVIEDYREDARPDVSRASADNAEETSSSCPETAAPPVSGSLSPSTDTTVTMDELREAEAKAALCREFIKLTTKEHLSGNQAAAKLQRPASWFSKNVTAFKREGVTGLLPRRRDCGAPAKFTELPAWFMTAAQFFYLQTNRTWNKGSTPEALRRTISLPLLPTGWTNKERARFLRHLGMDELPTCPETLRNEILEREKNGQPLLPARLLKEITGGEIAVRSHRAPREAWLNYVQSPGSLMLTIDDLTGFERYIEPGEVFTIDDGTINFPCVVPLNRPGDKCFDRWGVMVSRFQFLVLVDHRTQFIPGWCYTARPRSSYRAEDLTAAMHTTFVEHGRPQRLIMEHGISAAKLVQETLQALDVQRLAVSSPHQKVVEAIFGKLWTKLSVQFPNVQVGRYMGDEEESNKLIQSCREGAHDPRKYFPLLSTVLKIFREVIAELNATRVNSRYGNWTPEDWFKRDAAKNLRPLDPASAWMFSPTVTEPLKVRGMLVQTTVNFMPGYSQKFAFEAPCLSNYHGALVKLFFNPFAPDCVAKVVLAEDFGNVKAGTILGDATQFDREARYSRRVLEYGADPDIGLNRVKQHAQAVHRHAQAVRPGREDGATVVEARNGLGTVATLAVNTPSDEPRVPTSPALTPAPEASPERLASRRAELDAFEKENEHLFL